MKLLILLIALVFNMPTHPPKAFAFTMPTHPPGLSDFADKKVGHRISGSYRDKGFQDKINHPSKANPSPSPMYPYYPY